MHEKVDVSPERDATGPNNQLLKEAQLVCWRQQNVLCWTQSLMYIWTVRQTFFYLTKLSCTRLALLYKAARVLWLGL